MLFVPTSTRLVVAAIASFIAFGNPQRAVDLKVGHVIDHSMVVRRGVYRLTASEDLKTPALTIRGNNITIDFNGATLAGGPETADPDSFAGVGILIDGGSNITVKNAVIRGYKVGILARHSNGLHLTGNDLSYNWKQRLYSRIEKESLVDWMSYHQNEKDEWLRYGAAIYLSGCQYAEIDRNTVVQGQNGLMASGSSYLRIWNNTFQFLSGIGVGLYRVTASQIMHNKIDWCVRGYSHGFYSRGQDSAGLLMYEQSSSNIVAFNSITHGGDGLFLWAGQSTMDTGKGGSNDNIFFKNDFSHAVANGIEATFSRNIFEHNRIQDCWHGVWGGYSYESSWSHNHFANNTEAIAIEHGQNNWISENTFDGDETAIHLWQNPTQDPDWSYPKYRDTRSHGYNIGLNIFRANKTAILLRDTSDVFVTVLGSPGDAPPITRAGGTTGFQVAFQPFAPGDMPTDDLLSPMSDGIDAMIKPGERRGRDTIIVDEWGPYDWKSPKLWPVLGQPGLKGPDYGKNLTLRVLGPAGAWKVQSVHGASVDVRTGKTNDQLTVSPSPGSIIDYDIALEYRGEAVVSPRGVKTAAGKPYILQYSRFFVPINWGIKLFEYTDATDPVKSSEGFARLISGTPVKQLARDRLDYVSGRSIEDGVAHDRIALVAEGIADLPSGDYTLSVISDDGVRVWVDGEELIDAWSPHESRMDKAPIRGGRRKLKVEYYEIDGFAELRFDIQRR
jgi:nitrous oxidase accessory protein NosD